MSRMFLSHSSLDNFAAVAVSDWLREEGWDDVFLDLDPVRGIHAGERWERALYSQSRECEVVLFLVSRSWIGSEWCRREYDLARKLNKRTFVVLIEQIPIDELPLLLRETYQIVSLAAGEDHRVFRPKMPVTHAEGHVTFSAEGLERLKAGLTQAGLDPRFFAWPPEAEPDRAPYRGLEPLDGVDAGIFFGRDGPIIEVLDMLRGLRDATAPRLFVILGASGAGKSSFVRAGLLPRLARDDRNFRVLPVIRPERAAISGAEGLISALADAVIEQALTTTRAQIRDAVANGANALRSVLRSLIARAGDEKPTTLIITVDQAEELFRTEAGEEGVVLLNMVRDLAASDDPPVIALFVIRSDSYDALERAKPLEGLSQHTFALLPMPRGAYQTVIEGPAKRLTQAGRKFEIDPGLTEALLEDIETGGGSDALPLLSFTLEQLYRDNEAAKRIDHKDYRKFGGLKGAIDAALVRVFGAADSDARIPRDYDARLALLRRGFIPWLAGIDPETKMPRRRVARAAQIPEEARPLIDLLVEHRLLARDVDPKTGEATLEPAHEALLRQWGGLKGWLEEDFGRLAALDGVKRAAVDWDANARATAWAAHEGARLEEADQLDARPDLSALFNATDRAYLAACREKEKAARAAKEKQRRAEAELEREKTKELVDRLRYAGIGLALVVFLGGIATWKWYDARSEETIANNRLDAAKKAADKLGDLVIYRYRNMLGVPTMVKKDLLDIAGELQDQLIAQSADSDIQTSHAGNLEATVITCLTQGNTKCALEAAREAVNHREKLSVSDSNNLQRRYELAKSFNLIGLTLLERGDLRAASSFYNEALKISKELIKGNADDPIWHIALSFSLEGLGDVQIEQGDPAKAYAFYKESFDIRQKVWESEPNEKKRKPWGWLLPQSYRRLGDALLAQKDLGGALKLFHEGLRTNEKLSVSDSDTRLQQELVEGYNSIADVQKKQEKFEEALKSYENGSNKIQTLSRSDPGNALWKGELSDAYNKIGDVQEKQENFEKALNSYDSGLKIIRELSDSDPDNAKWKRSLSETYIRIGDVQKNRGEPAEALKSYRAALDLIGPLSDSDPDNAKWQRDILAYNERIGELLATQNDDEGAIVAYERALHATEALVKKLPDDFELRQSLIDLHCRLARLDKFKLGEHILATQKITDALLTSNRLDAYQRRYIYATKSKGCRQ